MTMKEMDADRHVGMAGRPNRGMLHIYLGAAPGAGKSYTMLQWDGILHGSVTSELLHKMPEIDILVVGNRQQNLV